MPIYEYKCENGHVFDVMQKMSDEPLAECIECGASLHGAELDRCDLSAASLDGTNLAGASLRGALAVKTGLRGASLPEADLMEAVVQRADLRGTDLRAANLSGDQHVEIPRRPGAPVTNL